MAVKGFGQRLLEARLNLAARRRELVTQVDVAAAMRVTNVTVSRWEGDVKVPAVETVIRLARFLEADPCWLLFGDDRGLIDGPADSVAPVPRKPEPVGGGTDRVKGVKHKPKKPRGLGGRGRR